MGWNNANLAAAQDAAAENVTYVGWSANGSSASAAVAPTAVTLKTATIANPSDVSNDGPLESAGATEQVTITHFAFGHDDGGFVPDTAWMELEEPVELEEDGTIEVADGDLTIHGYRTSGPPA